ncbi:VCBS repeat-containing protein [Archangium violaceum]|uniref:FG-GAP repeat domain-containing protein n=1 Tax=Archangium violaceum TaxID=83451 RepID=UPI00193BF360|nr:VCBS repeat-containing protein [Archangium violaceum]QRK10464.1 VCBS repeat-containing protein [Archangium violaceum]
MRWCAVSCLVTMALAVGCDESGPPVDQGAVSLHDVPRDMYGRPLVGTDGPMRYRDGVGVPAPGASSSSPSGVLESGLASVQFSLGAYTSRPVGSWPEAVAIGDVTCDGRPDVVMTTTHYFDAARDYRVFVFPQLAGGGLGTPVSYPYGATASRNGIALADLSKDGCLDVVVGHGSGLSVLLADKATGGLSPAVVVADHDADTLAATDVNRDGKLDIISLGWSRGASIFYGDGTGAFSRIVPFATKASGYNDHEVGDLNGDGIPDLAVMSGQGYAVPNLSVHLHDGTNALGTTPDSYFMGQNVLAGGVGLGDVNGDGRLDAVLSKPGNSPTVLWLMVQDANGNLVGPTAVSSYDIPESVQVADIDRDGDDDVVVVHGGWMKVGVYLQEAGALMPEVLYSIPYASHYAPQGLAVGDFSGDGCGDVAIADYNNGLVTLQGTCLR